MFAYVDVGAALTAVKQKFQTWSDNRLFSDYLEGIGDAVARLPASVVNVPEWPAMPLAVRPQQAAGFISSVDLFAAPAPALPDGEIGNVLKVSTSVSNHDHTSFGSVR